MSEHYVTLYMNKQWMRKERAPRTREDIACVTTLQDASWLLRTDHEQIAGEVAERIAREREAVLDVVFGCTDSRFGDVWRRVELRYVDGNRGVRAWHKLGEGSYGGAFAATLQCEPHPRTVSEWESLRLRQFPAWRTRASDAVPDDISVMPCAIKIPRAYIGMLQHKAPDGVMREPIRACDVVGADLARRCTRPSPEEMCLVMLDEIRVMHTLLFGVKHVHMGELSQTTAFALNIDQFRRAADEAHRKAATEGHRFLNHLLEFSTGAVPCTVCTLRHGDLQDHRVLNGFWGTGRQAPDDSPNAFGSACYQVYHGLRYMHSSNFAHMDIKPDNILYDLRGGDGLVWCYIADFGLSTRIDVPATSHSGTKVYSAPELKKADETNPVFNMGACDAHSYAVTMLALLAHASLDRSVLQQRGRDVYDMAYYLVGKNGNVCADMMRSENDAGSRPDRQVVARLLDVLEASDDPERRADIFYSTMCDAVEPFRIASGGGELRHARIPASRAALQPRHPP